MYEKKMLKQLVYFGNKNHLFPPEMMESIFFIENREQKR